MFILIQFVFLVSLFSIQTTVLDFFTIAGVMPDLALIFVVYCGIYFQGSRGIGMGVVVGLVQDALSGGLLGVNTLSKGLVGFIFSTLKDKLIVEGFIPIFFFIAVSSLVDGLIFYLVLVTLLKGTISSGFLVTDLPIYAVYNALLGPILFAALNVKRKWILNKIPNTSLRPL